MQPQSGGMESKMIIRETQLYKKEIREINRELAKLPEGSLTKKGSSFYELTKTTQKGISKDPARIRLLARKAYILRRLKHLEWNLSLAEKQCPRFKTEDPAEIISGLPQFFRELPIEYFYPQYINDGFGQKVSFSAGSGNAGSGSAGSWSAGSGNAGNGGVGNMDAGSRSAGTNVSQNRYREEELIYFTKSGLRVRSKSERTIADALDHNKILYRYEAAVQFGNVVKFPDFTAYRLSDKKMIIWEHFGRMDDAEYRKNTNEKLAFYGRHSFYPFDKLICTYEQDLQRSDFVQTIIELFFLS